MALRARLDIARWPDGAVVSRLDWDRDPSFDPDYDDIDFAYLDDRQSKIDLCFIYGEFTDVPVNFHMGSDRLHGLFNWTNLGSVWASMAQAQSRLRWALLATARPGVADRETSSQNERELILPRELPEQFLELLGPGSRVERALDRELSDILAGYAQRDSSWPRQRSAPRPDLIDLVREAGLAFGDSVHLLVDQDGRHCSIRFRASPSRQPLRLMIGDLRQLASRPDRYRELDSSPSDPVIDFSHSARRWLENNSSRLFCAVANSTVSRVYGVGSTPWEAVEMVEFLHPYGQRAQWDAKYLEPGELLISPEELELYELLGQWHPCWWPNGPFREYVASLETS
jgi:hypothetical protein